MNYYWLLAMAPAPSGGGQGGGIPYPLIMIAIIGLSFWFIILRPQQKQQKERQNLLSAVKKGDKIVTIGGMYGTVVDVDNKTGVVTVEVSKNVRIDFTKSAISSVVKRADDKNSINKSIEENK